MALFGDTAFLLTHIRRCFVLGDESGICEHLVGDEWISQQELDAIYSLKGPILPIVDTEREDFAGKSPELFPKIGHVEKRPSRVEGRLADLRNEKAVEKRSINIDLRTMKIPSLTDEERDELFKPTELVTFPNEWGDTSYTPNKAVKSMLTQLMERVSTENGDESNPFASYAQFDGHHLLPNVMPSSPTSQNTTSSKITSVMGRPGVFGPVHRQLSRPRLHPVRIFFWYLPLLDGEIRRKPLLLQPVPGVTVANMIGLAHYQYSKEDRQPPVKSVRLSELEVFPFDEDLNELECDFSSLGFQDELSKYQFDAFAIVERSKVRALRESRRISNSHVNSVAQSGLSTFVQQEICVTIYMAQGHSKIMFSPDITLKDLLERVIRRRGLRELEGYPYRLESFDTPEMKLDLSLRLSDTGMRAFSLVRDHSRREPLVPPEINEEDVESSEKHPGHPSSPLPPVSPVFPSQNSANSGGLNSQENLSQRQYRVQLKKGIMNRDVYLIVSPELVEVSPIAGRTPWPRKKKSPHKYPIHLIADCEYEEPKERNNVRKVSFKIIYLSTESQFTDILLANGKGYGALSSYQQQACMEELQSLAFEAQWSTTRNVHKKLVTILDYVKSSLRNAYLTQSK